MNHLKLFEDYNKEDDLQKAENFLDDTFDELMDDWSFSEGTVDEVADGTFDERLGIYRETKQKVYYFHKNLDRRNVYLYFILDKEYAASDEFDINDFLSDINEVFKKVKLAYPMSSIENGSIFHPSFVPLYRVMISVNVDGKNDGSF
jgi:hypothetical protein